MGRGRGVERDRGGGVEGCKRFLFRFVNGMLRHDHLERIERVLPPHRQHRGHQQRQMGPKGTGGELQQASRYIQMLSLTTA